MSAALDWTVVVLFALGMAGVVAGTIHLAKVSVDRAVRQGFAPLAAQLEEYRTQRKARTRP